MSEDQTRTRYCSRCLTTFIGDLERCPNLGCRTRKPAQGWGTLLEAGDTFDRHYRIEKRLAIGGAGVTYLGREVDAAGDMVGPWLAIKVLYAQRDEGSFLRRLSNEAQILQELDHPGIVQLMGFVHRRGHSPYLLTRFEEGGSLLDHLRRVGALSLKGAARIGLQLCDALFVAHERGVIHRDLKPENVLLARVPGPGEVPQVRITDFGIAKVSGGVGGNLTKVGAFVGTPQYAAPEQFEGRLPTPATDVYALGAVLNFLVTLRPLVPTADQLSPEQTLDIMMASLPPRLALAGVDPGELAAFNAFLAATMTPDLEERGDLYRARELLDAVVYDQPPILSLQSDGRTLTAGPLEPVAPTDETFGPSADTFEGILSRTDPEVGELMDLSAPAPEKPRDNSGELVDLAAVPPSDTPPPALPPELPPNSPPPFEPEPAPELPATEEEPEPPPKKKKGNGMLYLGAAVVFLGIVGLGALMGAALYGVIDIDEYLPDGLTIGDDGADDGGADDGGADVTPTPAPAADITLDPRKPLHQKELRVIDASIREQVGALEACALGEESSVNVKLIVSPSGEILSATASGLDNETRVCVQDVISNFTLERGSTPIGKKTIELRTDIPTK